jgi:hypothetical protein
MPTKEELRQRVRSRLDETIRQVNMALRGGGLDALEPVLARTGRGGQLPHWFERLKKTGGGGGERLAAFAGHPEQGDGRLGAGAGDESRVADRRCCARRSHRRMALA